jgi:hypothetical protein
MLTLTQHPGVRYIDSKKPHEIGWYAPKGLVDLGRLPGSLNDVDPNWAPTHTLFGGLELRDYQRRAIAILRYLTPEREGAILAADMGLGKTISALEALNQLGALDGPGVVCGLKRGRRVWCGPVSDAKRYYNLDIVPLAGVKGGGVTNVLNEARWVYVHYEILRHWHAWISAMLRPRVVIFDEIHHLANPSAQRTKAARSLTLTPTTDFRLGLTGTPVPNYRIDLWSPLRLVQPRQWGKNRDKFGQRYCHAAGTRITMGDYSVLPIEQVRVGDSVIGYEIGNDGWTRPKRTEVLEIFRHYEQLWRLVLEDGTVLYTTKDHQWFKPKSHGRCRSPYGPVHGRGRVLKRWPWAASDDWQPTEEFALGWLRGVMDGDGTKRKRAATPHLIKHGHRAPTYESYLAQNVKLNGAVLDRAEVFARLVGWIPKRSRYKDGMARVLFKKRSAGQGGQKIVGKPIYDFFTSELSGDESDDFSAGWLSGMYDAEGHGNTISQSPSANPIIYAHALRTLLRFGYDVRPLNDGRGGFRIRGGQSTFQSFVTRCHPCKVHALDTWAPKSLRAARSTPRVKSFQPTGVIAPVFNIRTATGNYFAEHLASKNCGARRADEREGGHWVFEEETNTVELRARLAGTLIRYTKADVKTQLPPLHRHRIPLEDVDPELMAAYDKAQLDIKRYLRDAQKGQEPEGEFSLGEEVCKASHEPGTWRIIAMTTLMGILSEIKRTAAPAAVFNALNSHNMVVAFTYRVAAAEHLAEKLREMDPTGALRVFGPVTGKMDEDQRAALAAQFLTLRGDPNARAVYVATIGSSGRPIYCKPRRASTERDS